MSEYHVQMLPVQREFFDATDPFVAIVSSRSCGKSWIAMFSSLRDMLEGKNVIYMAQTDGAFYKGPWQHLQNFLTQYNLMDRWSWNSTYKIGTLDLGGGIKPRFYYGSYENEKSGRGATECSTLTLDEFMLSRPNILATMAPCLRGKDNFGNIIVPKIRAVGTPDMSSMWQIMVVEHEKYGICLLRTKMSENVFMTDQQRDTMASVIFDEKLRRQEIEGEIIVGEDSTSLISLSEFLESAPLFPDDRVFAGLDMAHTGQRDSHSFAAVKGSRLLALHEFGISSSEDVAAYIRRFNAKYPIHHLDMDLAWSESVYDQLKYEIPCTQVSFANSAPKDYTLQYANIRAYGYFKMAKVLKSTLFLDPSSEFVDPSAIPEFKKEICNTHFVMDRLGRLLIEPKDDIRMRIGRSPDPADSLMLALLERPERIDPPMNVGAVSAVTDDEIRAIMEDD